MKTVMPQIDHLVLLMLENRSLDNVLGWLYEDTGNVPKNVVPSNSRKNYDGLVAGKFSNPYSYKGKTRSYEVKKGLTGNPQNVPDYDPYEPYKHVNNQVFGSATPWQKDNTPTKSNTPNPSRSMRGFFQDYSANWMTWEQTLQILQTYTPTDLPVINTLARKYSVSDRWFSSAPTQTNPNRAFTHCGTSLGRVKNQNETSIEQFKWWDRKKFKYVWARNIWDVLGDHGVSWRIYYHEAWPPILKTYKGYTHYTFLGYEENLRRFRRIKSFGDDVKNNKLDPFVFIEPKWGGGFGGLVTSQGNDFHPPANVRPGEILLKKVFEQLTSNSKVWNKTLLVITFDEHGGTYDHVTPPWGAVPPGDGRADKGGFKFNRYGVRVPTILVSPWIEEGTVFRAGPGKHYDHTSLIATILKWRGIDPAKSGLNNRVSQAPCFDNVLTRRRPRTDKPELKLAPVPKLRPISLENRTNTKVKIYLGWGSSYKKPYVLKATGQYKRGSTFSYDANKDELSHDYWVAVGYWAGPSTDKDPVDRESGPQWRLLWKRWKHILHHQTMVVRQAPISTKFSGNDKYDRNSRISIVNKTASRVYYHLYSRNEKTGIKGRTVTGYINRGKTMIYRSGKDVLWWKYTVNFSTWVGDTTVKGKEKIDGTIDRSWRLHWSAAKPMKRNGTLTIIQAKPKASFDPDGWDIFV